MLRKATAATGFDKTALSFHPYFLLPTRPENATLTFLRSLRGSVGGGRRGWRLRVFHVAHVVVNAALALTDVRLDDVVDACLAAASDGRVVG